MNPRTLPEYFAPISPPPPSRLPILKNSYFSRMDIISPVIQLKKDHKPALLFRASEYSITTSFCAEGMHYLLFSDIVFESSASEGAILIMPRGARSEDLGNLAKFRERKI